MSKPSHFIKRIADIIFVLLLSPLILVLTILIAAVLRITAGPPVFFTQQRAGKNAHPFDLRKFRTMRTDVDRFGPSPKSGADPRLTPIGKILRTFSLDELPQFWNVLRGELSLVGPRPLYLSQIPEWNEHQRRRLLVKPGLTGLAQISGRASLTVEQKLELDVQYVDRQSLALDARIVLATILRLFFPRDIYEKRYSQTHETRTSPEPSPADAHNRPTD